MQVTVAEAKKEQLKNKKKRKSDEIKIMKKILKRQEDIIGSIDNVSEFVFASMLFNSFLLVSLIVIVFLCR